MGIITITNNGGNQPMTSNLCKCGTQPTTPFCPQCGGVPGNPLVQLYVHVAASQRGHAERAKKEFRPHDWGRHISPEDAQRRHNRQVQSAERAAKKWAAWQHALEEIMPSLTGATAPRSDDG